MTALSESSVTAGPAPTLTEPLAVMVTSPGPVPSALDVCTGVVRPVEMVTFPARAVAKAISAKPIVAKTLTLRCICGSPTRPTQSDRWRRGGRGFTAAPSNGTCWAQIPYVSDAEISQLAQHARVRVWGE